MTLTKTAAFALLLLAVPSYAAEEARFDPVEKTIEGWTVFVEPAVAEAEPGSEDARALGMLEAHLRILTAMVPAERVKQLQTLPIWIEHDHPTLKNMQYHPSLDWLKENGHDPRLAKKVHLPVARNLISSGQLAKQPMVILHELSHAYHDQILGFDEARILAAYKKAKDAGSYEKVLSYNGKTVSHYALTDHKEYFAEGTEAFFNRNDFYPFVRAELKIHDLDLHQALLEIWGDPAAGEPTKP
jgi:dipeptidyl-peptidase-4